MPNIAAVIGGDLTGAVKEDEILTASGQLTIGDVDGEREFIPVVDLPTPYGLFSLTKDGAWTFQISDNDSLPSWWQATLDLSVEAKDGTQATITITVDGTNDAPTFTSSPGGSVDEGGSFTQLVTGSDLDNDQFSFSIVDHPEHGTASITGDQFTYTAYDDDYYGLDPVAIQVSDNYGGTEIRHFAVLVGNERDAPFGTNKSVTIAEDGSHTVMVDDFGFSDYKDAGLYINHFDAAIISAVTGDGELWFGNAELDLSNGAVRISKADIEAGKLVWKPDADASGQAHITFKVKDDGGVNVQDNNTSKDANTLTIDVAAVNDAPVGADASHTVNEDAVFNFSADMFGFSDPDDGGADTLSHVIIDDLVGNGDFMLGNKAIVEGQTIDADDLSRLTFKGDKNGFGDNYASLEFTVVDNGGAANGGRNTAEESNRLTFDLADVVDTFNGRKGKDTLRGTAGDDILNGKAGNDRLTGKAGMDIFMFKTGYDKDIITDFNATGDAHDVLDISGLRSIASFEDLMAHHVDKVKGGVMIDGGRGDTITLQGVKLGDLDAGDFMI